jgi:integrase/recombinase XerD
MAKKAKVLTKVDVKRVLAIAATQQHAARNRAIFNLCRLAGLRAIEVSNLTIQSVLGANGVVDTLNFTKSGTKGNKARSVPISKRLAKELAIYLETLDHRSLEPHRPLFVSQKGGGFTPHGIVMLLQRMYRDAGINDASSHSGRRSFASGLAEKGVSVFVLKELLGHSSIQTTSGYVHAGEHQQRNAVELM